MPARNAAFAAALLTATAAHAATYAPPNRPGPALSVPQSAITASLSCTGSLTDPAHAPILLVPGTASTPQTAFSWNYERAFAADGRPFCAITLPGIALNDIQTAGEYITGAIRTLYAADNHRRIAIVGWSQGGMVPRWALRFWPDTRPMVAKVIGIDPSNHGTLDATECYATQSCPAAFWQQASVAHFIAALNSYAETFAGIAYTVVYSRTDEVVVPNLDAAGSSSLRTGAGHRANIAVQSICPADTSEHLAMGTYDPVGYAVVIDALDHAGPADPARISRAVCLQAVQPGVKPATLAQHLAAFDLSVVTAAGRAPKLASEPALAGYTLAK